VTHIRLSAYAFGSSTSTKRQGAYVEHQNVQADGPALRANGPWSGLYAVAAWTIHACAKSVRVLDFLRDLLAKPVGLTRGPTFNRSRPPPLYR
jgi:hypothetical protein